METTKEQEDRFDHATISPSGEIIRAKSLQAAQENAVDSFSAATGEDTATWEDAKAAGWRVVYGRFFKEGEFLVTIDDASAVQPIAELPDEALEFLHSEDDPEISEELNKQTEVQMLRSDVAKHSQELKSAHDLLDSFQVPRHGLEGYGRDGSLALIQRISYLKEMMTQAPDRADGT